MDVCYIVITDDKVNLISRLRMILTYEFFMTEMRRTKNEKAVMEMP